jgi:hypothetical protein
MSERYLHPTLPGMSKVEMFESMSKDALVDHILVLGERGQQIQSDMDLAADVLAGAFGVTVPDVLKERENTNGDPAA